MTDKTESSISIEDAEQIAYETASAKCNINEYVLSETKEVLGGYLFKYSKYIDGYRTAESVSVTVAYDGNIYKLALWTDIFDGIEIKILMKLG